jgi:hypothetical protein
MTVTGAAIRPRLSALAPGRAHFRQKLPRSVSETTSSEQVKPEGQSSLGGALLAQGCEQTPPIIDPLSPPPTQVRLGSHPVVVPWAMQALSGSEPQVQGSPMDP